MAFAVAPQGTSCWQCGADAQRSKNGVGACRNHLLPNRKERRAMRGNQGQQHSAPAGPRPSERTQASARDTQHKPKLRIVKPEPVTVPTSAKQAGQDGIVDRHTVVCSCDRMDLDHTPGRKPDCAGLQHDKIVTVYGGGLPLKRTGPDTSHLKLSRFGHGEGQDLIGQAYRKRGRKIDY